MKDFVEYKNFTQRIKKSL